MKKIIIVTLCAALLLTQAFAADGPSGDTPAPARYSIFSTSTDWEALTGLQLHQYSARFIADKSLIGRQGLVLYYLDGFPCYGLGYGVRVWLGPRGQHDGELHIACVYPPKEIKFTYRNATRDADQAQSTGMLTCPTTGDRELTIDLSRCTRSPDWAEME